MTLASCHDRNITKSERHVENAFRLVNRPANLTPMWDGLLPSSDSTTFWGPRARSSKESSKLCSPISKLITSPYASGRTHRVESRSHSLSDVCTDRNNAAEHTAEIAVASHRAAEIE